MRQGAVFRALPVYRVSNLGILACCSPHKFLAEHVLDRLL